MPQRASTIHRRVTWEPIPTPDEVVRSSIGGYPVLPDGQDWPLCAEDDCGERMSLFFQFAVEESYGLSFAPGSALSVFQCLKHDDPFEELDARAPGRKDKRLPEGYWNHLNYALFFTSPGGQRQLPEREPHVVYSKLVVSPEPAPGPRSVEALNYKDIKIGGAPFWGQKPKLWGCSCGAAMVFLCSMPENLKYPRVEGSPRQPNVYSDGHHLLFLGLSTYVFACEARCHPRAVVAVRQN